MTVHIVGHQLTVKGKHTIVYAPYVQVVVRQVYIAGEYYYTLFMISCMSSVTSSCRNIE